MTIIMTCEQDGVDRRLKSADGAIHVPRRKDFVRIKERLYQVVRVTTAIHGDFTTDPVVEVQLKRV